MCFKVRSNNRSVIPSEVASARRTTLNYCHGISRLPFARLGITAACGLAVSLLTVITADAGETIHKGDVVVVPLHGEVMPPLLAFLRRAVKTAENNQASAIIFDINTYGGRLDTATDIVNALNQIKIPTYTFINTNAGSAGTVIAIATEHIYMASVSAIGAAAPILATGEDLPAIAREKTISYWSALIRGSATKNGHNPDLAEAFMNRDKEVKIGDRVVHPKGQFSLSMHRKRPKRLTANRCSQKGLSIRLLI
jgi:membrane-bound ClpP family serine protease